MRVIERRLERVQESFGYLTQIQVISSGGKMVGKTRRLCAYERGVMDMIPIQLASHVAMLITHCTK